MKKVASGKSQIHGTRPASLSGMIVIFFLAAATFAAPYLLAAADKKDSQAKSQQPSSAGKGLPTEALTGDEAILQALNRLGFGPRPGDVELVKQIGLQKWIEQQLHRIRLTILRLMIACNASPR